MKLKMPRRILLRSFGLPKQSIGGDKNLLLGRLAVAGREADKYQKYAKYQEERAIDAEQHLAYRPTEDAAILKFMNNQDYKDHMKKTVDAIMKERLPIEVESATSAYKASQEYKLAVETEAKVMVDAEATRLLEEDKKGRKERKAVRKAAKAERRHQKRELKKKATIEMEDEQGKGDHGHGEEGGGEEFVDKMVDEVPRGEEEMAEIPGSEEELEEAPDSEEVEDSGEESVVGGGDTELDDDMSPSI